MTTTKELRAALNAVEPAFPGLDLAAIRYQAVRIRRRRRIAAAALGMSVVATGVGLAPHHAEGGHSPPMAVGAALPPRPIIQPTGGESRHLMAGSASASSVAGLLAAPVRPRTGALPKVAAMSAELPVFGSAVWIRPSTTRSSPYLCWGAQATGTDGCSEFDRGADGVVSWAMFEGTDKRQVVVIVEGPARTAAAFEGGSSVETSAWDLGSGYSAIIATLTPRDTNATAVVVSRRDDRSLSARWAATIPKKGSQKGTLAVPLTWPDSSSAVPLADTGRLVWLERRKGEKHPRVCNALASGAAAPTCAPLAGTGGGAGHAFTLTAPDGKQEVTSLVTASPVASASATLDGKTTGCAIRYLGSGYTMISATVPRGGGGPQHLVLSAVGKEGNETAHFELSA